MKKIPIRHIKDSFIEEKFSIRPIEPLVSNEALIHDMHRHDFYFALFVKNGSGEHEIDFINYSVKDYSVYFIRPGQVHQLKLEKGASGFMLQFASNFFAFNETITSDLLREVSNKSYCQLNAERFEKLFLLLVNIFHEFTQKQERYKEAIKASLDLLFIELVRNNNNVNEGYSKSKLYIQQRLEQFNDLLESNIQTKKQVKEYAEMLNISTYQLNAITKELLHKTASDLINEQIILDAKRLLIGTVNQVNQIADLLGYEDTSYFIRFFKKQTGSTPETFRQNYK